MKREFLKGLGLEDTVIDNIMTEHGKGIENEKAKLIIANQAKTDLETQLAKSAKDLEALQKSASGNEDLQKQITALQEAAKHAETEYKQNLSKTEKMADAKVLLGDSAHNSDFVLGLFDWSKDVKEELARIQKDTPFVFKAAAEGQPAPAAQGTPKPAGFRPVEGQPPAAAGSAADYATRLTAATTLSQRVAIKQEAAQNGVFLN